MTHPTPITHGPIAVRPRPSPFAGTNPYLDRPLSQLFAACQQRADGLLRREHSYTPEERASLAHDTAHLLLAVSPALAHGEDMPGSPARAILQGRGDFVEEHWRAHESALRSARYRTLVMASDLALGGQARVWRRDARIEGELVYDLALSSEMGLLRTLSELAKRRSIAPRRR
ncbi:MAG TPA: hypothetical protein VIT90_05170 [Lysobacter sp.]